MMKMSATVISVKRMWWLKVNTKACRANAMDGAVFPHVIKVSYKVDGVTYTKKKWISAGKPVPEIGSSVQIMYSEANPQKAQILL